MSEVTANAHCSCGKVELEIDADPILKTVCNCGSCRQAAHIFEQLPGAEPIAGENGGVPYILFRKDAIRCTAGQDHLRDHRLTESSPTRRIVATCCNTFMFLDFTKGHWVSVFPPILDDQAIVEQAPVKDRQSPMFILTLLTAWAGMGFRMPKIQFVKGKLESV